MLGFTRDDLEDGMRLAGIDTKNGDFLAGDDDDEGFGVGNVSDLNMWADQVVGAPRMTVALRKLGRVKVKPALAKTKLGKVVKRIGRISRGLLAHTGKVEADRLNRPNVLSSIYGTDMAPAASLAFTVQPGSGNSYYRILGFIADDLQAPIFGFSSLKIGGQEHVQSIQTVPTAPVTNAVPWSMFALKEPYLVANLNPWVGQVFDSNTPLTGTIVNMSTAGGDDATTRAPRMVILLQTDPCGTRTAQQQEAASRFWAQAHKQGGLYTASFLGMR